MKRFFLIILTVLFTFSGCVFSDRQKPEPKAEICATWIYYNELSMKSETGGNEKSFLEKINTMLDKCAEKGINTVFIQVRPFADAFYPSELFPWSEYLTGTQGKAVNYDPLKIIIEAGHARNIKIHAWINPFRISFKDNPDALSDDNVAKKWADSKSADVVKADGGLYFSPASEKAQKLVLDGVREIVSKYDVDGIHIDDYFYPSTDEAVDEKFYEEYVDSGGELKLSEWRLSIISAFVGQMYSAVKSENSACIFSVSPAGNIENNYYQQYADVRLWCSVRGYCDWIIPQLYYGFEDEKLSFDEALRQWQNIDRIDSVKMFAGIGAYKVNDSDEEWNAGNGIIEKQLNCLKEADDYFGAAFFSYTSITDEKRSAEFENLGTRVLTVKPAELS